MDQGSQGLALSHALTETTKETSTKKAPPKVRGFSIWISPKLIL